MSTALTMRRDYLVPQRRTIIARALAGSLAGAVPVPFLDDWAMGAVLGGGYRRIAAAHHVDVDDDAVKSLVFGTAKSPSISDLAVGGIVMRIAGRAAKRMMLVLATINRARSAAKNFVIMTLFDHYCARLHTGLALDRDTALALRGEILAAIEQTPGALSFHPFRRGALAAARATVRAPLELADIATGGAIRKLLAKKSEVTEAEAVSDMDLAVEKALESKTGFLSRTVAAVEIQLTAEQNPFLDAAIENLDRRWRARMAVENK
ncbi:MAG TPA: hypothetical protein VFO79_10165 [Xanthomonadales bacterium]|nr:hypothetical protein [Xanthomonadales bacterium]